MLSRPQDRWPRVLSGLDTHTSMLRRCACGCTSLTASAIHLKEVRLMGIYSM